ncbi:MAG TPA: aminofutalosine synthase MqnE [Chthoniobacterales bacterium]
MIAPDVANAITVTGEQPALPSTSPRLNERDALHLFQSDDLAALSTLATRERDRRHYDRAYYIVNRHINYSNICILECAFCAFGKRRRDAEAYELTVDEIATRAAAAHAHGASEIHMVGGLHPTWGFAVYLEILAAIRSAAPRATVKAFTAVEILHLAWVGKRSVDRTIEELRDAGLGCLTGGGAEIFAPAVRRQICRGKESGEDWLKVHRTAHRLGVRSTATMLFGHLESYEDRVDHLTHLRELQDETGGFLAFLPLPFKPANRLRHLAPPGDQDTLKTIAVARAYLDNFAHIKAYWVSSGLPLAQRALHFGADDLDGTIEEERIYHMAGATSPVQQTIRSLQQAIIQAGYRPVLRNAFYDEIKPMTDAS